MNMTRIFFGVGQGAFYCEIFNEARFQVIYDCGSISKGGEKLIETCIDERLNPEFETLIFISHFHADHINGIPILVKKCNVKWIFFPYLTKENRGFMIFYNTNISKIYEDEINSNSYDFDLTLNAEFVFKFIENPENTINKLLDDILKEKKSNAISNTEKTDQKKKIKLYAILEYNMLSSNDSWNNVEVIKSGTNIMDRLCSDLSGQVFFKDFWEYYSYNIEESKNKQRLLKKFKTEFNETVTFDEFPKRLNELYKVNSQGKLTSDGKKINRIFREIGEANTNSMIFISKNSGSVYTSGCYTCKFHCGNKYCTISDKCKFLRSSKNVTEPAFVKYKTGFLYTGDFDAKNNFKEINTYCSDKNDLWEYIGGIQIPHHGSDKNFNEELFNNHIRDSKNKCFNGFCVVSFGYNNIYKHPAETVINQIPNLIPVYFICQNSSFELNVKYESAKVNEAELNIGKIIPGELVIASIDIDKDDNYNIYNATQGISFYVKKNFETRKIPNKLKRIIQTEIEIEDEDYICVIQSHIDIKNYS